MESGKLKNLILISILVLISFSVYFNSLRGDFLVDDAVSILDDHRVHDLKTFFTKNFNIRDGVLWDATRALLWHFSGSGTFDYHLFNLFSHIICVILVFILLELTFNNKSLSFLSSLIFTLHPIHTEAISWISGGNYPFSSIFFLASLIFYIKSDKSISNFSLSMLFMGLCLLAGHMVATLPLMFIFYEFALRGDAKGHERLKRFRLWVLFLLCLIAVIFLARIFVLRDKFMHTIFSVRGPRYLIVVAKALVYYLKIIYLPVSRGLYHPFAYTTTKIDRISPAFFVSLIIISLSVYLFIKCFKKYKPLSFGVAWFFITYLPYSNIIPVCNIVSERYMYLPSLGFAIIMAYLFLKIWEIINKGKAQRALLRCFAITAITLFLGSYSILTVKHNIEFSNIVTYWETNIMNFPEGFMAYNNLAGTYYCLGNKDQAIAYCWVSLMVNQDQPHVWCNLGKVYREKGNIKEALFCYEEALKVDKTFVPAIKALEEIKKQEGKKASGAR